MAALELSFVLLALVAGVLAVAYGVGLARGGMRVTHRREVRAWPRYYVRYHTFALRFIAFDMEMAYMYPCAVTSRPGRWRATTPCRSAWSPSSIRRGSVASCCPHPRASKPRGSAGAVPRSAAPACPAPRNRSRGPRTVGRVTGAPHTRALTPSAHGSDCRLGGRNGRLRSRGGAPAAPCRARLEAQLTGGAPWPLARDAADANTRPAWRPDASQRGGSAHHRCSTYVQ